MGPVLSGPCISTAPFSWAFGLVRAAAICARAARKAASPPALARFCGVRKLPGLRYPLIAADDAWVTSLKAWLASAALENAPIPLVTPPFVQNPLWSVSSGPALMALDGQNIPCACAGAPNPTKATGATPSQSDRKRNAVPPISAPNQSGVVIKYYSPYSRMAPGAQKRNINVINLHHIEEDCDL